MYCEVFNVLDFNILHIAIIYLMFTIILLKFSFWSLREAQELSFPLTESLSETQVFVTDKLLKLWKTPRDFSLRCSWASYHLIGVKISPCLIKKQGRKKRNRKQIGSKEQSILSASVNPAALTHHVFKSFGDLRRSHGSDKAWFPHEIFIFSGARLWRGKTRPPHQSWPRSKSSCITTRS